MRGVARVHEANLPVRSPQTFSLLKKLGQDWYLLLWGDLPAMVIEIITTHCNRGEIAGRGMSYELAVENRCSPPHLLSK